ncbi:TetR/AcrR family transcriptional regulator [Demequina sp. NBRC 110053]|uniref:TetR/AcrR family transcriptional regulator n=1 Tax=Demequina sp. NBRC 110053 TaxID=1570342 RepID=UPI0013566AAF|nr:TetR/AcrR family transcriptional regulator [Demequina sp. NBRC 110053]
MPRPATDKRERLTAAAATLAYTRGLERTTLGDVASEAGVATGSVYYYFKSKDDLGLAIVDQLRERYAALVEEWNAAPDPRARLAAYVDMHLRDAGTITSYGCPIGSLCSEARKVSEDLGDSAAEIFTMTIAWATEQFEALGFPSDASRARALHLVTGIQGAAVLTNALSDPEPLEREAAHLKRWIATTSA